MHARPLRGFLALAFSATALLVGAGCAHHADDGNSSSSGGVATPLPFVTATPEPVLSAGETAAPTESPTPTPLPSGATPTPEPTPTPNPNLLSWVNGTIVRSYPTAMSRAPEDLAESGSDVKVGSQGPYTIVYELPGIAQISKFQVVLPRVGASDPPTKVTISGSTTSAASGFADIASAQSSTETDTEIVPVNNASARWVRATFDAPGTSVFGGLVAFGTLSPRPSGAPLAGTFIERDAYALADGTFHPEPKPSDDDWRVGVVTVPGGVTGQRCYPNKSAESFPGSYDGRVWTWSRPDKSFGRYVVNDEGSIIAGQGSGAAHYLTRITNDSDFCTLRPVGGNGPDRVLVLDSGGTGLYPLTKLADAPRERFDRLSAGLLDAGVLANYSTLLFDSVCQPDQLLSAQQARVITDWVAAGHKLIITDADTCNNSNYDFLPYPFVSNNPGARGSASHHLIEVENDALGSLDPADRPHALDPQPWATGDNQIGDANTVVSQDTHWCGHLFGTNANNVNGFMQMYATYGKGLLIFDGFDEDDGDNPTYEQMRKYELAVTPEANLPCTKSVALGFVIQPDRSAKFTPGKPERFVFPMELLANQGYKGHITLSMSGDFAAKVTPSSFDIAGATQPLSVALGLPGNTKPGTYAIVVAGVGSDGQKAQATITIEATTPIAKQLKVQRRIRLYGIHFDVDSAHIQPRSEPVIADVAKIMREEPSWRFRIEGHTDSDGGLDHNAVLSQARAQSVVDDLVKRYHIARSRMVPKGFGYSRPVATNSTAAGKALNRRVELVRL
jgi:outer membrane protein OmpA-like peptidoglycan-associated protein